MSFWKYAFRGQKEAILPSRFGEQLFRQPRHFRFDYEEVMKMKHIAEWQNQNGVDTNNSDFWLSQANHLHREGNWWFFRSTIARTSLFLLLLAASEPFVTKARYDWQDNHEMKHEQKIYADLEEGGDEGGDDD